MEEDIITYGEFLDMILLTNKLISMETNYILEYYKKDGFNFFIDELVTLILHNPGFFYLSDEILDKISTIVNVIRFEDKRYNQDCNEINLFINNIKGMYPDIRQTYINQYIAYQSDVRRVDIDSAEDCLDLMSSDGFIYSLMQVGKLDMDAIDVRYFLSSTMYFLNTMPSIYHNAFVRTSTIDYLECIKKYFKIPLIHRRQRKYLEQIEKAVLS